MSAQRFEVVVQRMFPDRPGTELIWSKPWPYGDPLPREGETVEIRESEYTVKYLAHLVGERKVIVFVR